MTRPIALTIGGFDPSAGAGVLADIKTFESFRVYGVSVITGNTIQNDVEFRNVYWVDAAQKEEGIKILSERMNIKAIKLGMHRDLNDVMHSVSLCRKYFPSAFIAWDPVLKSSSGYDLEWKLSDEKLNTILSLVDLITPNIPEYEKLFSVAPEQLVANKNIDCALLLKGGHAEGHYSVDKLFRKNMQVIEFSGERIDGNKRGTGCVLSAGITAGITLNYSLEESIHHAKNYITKFFKSNKTILGYHFN